MAKTDHYGAIYRIGEQKRIVILGRSLCDHYDHYSILGISEDAPTEGDMAALHRHWERLSDLLPTEIIERLQQQYAEDASRDQRNSRYRTYKRYEREANATLTLATLKPIHPRTIELAQQKLTKARAWLSTHMEWEPS